MQSWLPCTCAEQSCELLRKGCSHPDAVVVFQTIVLIYWGLRKQQATPATRTRAPVACGNCYIATLSRDNIQRWALLRCTRGGGGIIGNTTSVYFLKGAHEDTKYPTSAGQQGSRCPQRPSTIRPSRSTCTPPTHQALMCTNITQVSNTNTMGARPLDTECLHIHSRHKGAPPVPQTASPCHHTHAPKTPKQGIKPNNTEILDHLQSWGLLLISVRCIPTVSCRSGVGIAVLDNKRCHDSLRRLHCFPAALTHRPSGS